MAWYADVTVGTGKDYATLVLFEAAYDGEDLTGTDGVRGRCTGIVTTWISYWSGWQAGQTSTCKIVITADTGQFTNGKDLGTGAEVNHAFQFDEATNPICIDIVGLELSGFQYPLRLYQDSNNGIFQIAKCLIVGTGNGGYIIYPTGCGTTTVNVGGCIIRSSGAGSYGHGIFNNDADVTLNIFNCAFDDHARAVYNSQAAATVTVSNCAAINCGADWVGVDTETTDKSENDGTCTDDDADDFTAPSTYDYHVYDTASALYHTGTAIADAWFTSLCATDFDGTAWAVAPSIGAYEYVAAGGRTTKNTDPWNLGQRHGMSFRMT